MAVLNKVESHSATCLSFLGFCVGCERRYSSSPVSLCLKNVETLIDTAFPFFCACKSEDSLDIMILSPFYFPILNDIIFYKKVGEKVALYIEDLRKLCTVDGNVNKWQIFTCGRCK